MNRRENAEKEIRQFYNPDGDKNITKLSSHKALHRFPTSQDDTSRTQLMRI